MKFHLIPKSKAKTSWGLLREVRKAMLAEPRRVNMEDFVRDLDNLFVGTPPDEYPACGTQGCVAGWMHLLTAKRADEAANGMMASRHAIAMLPSSAREEILGCIVSAVGGAFRFAA